MADNLDDEWWLEKSENKSSADEESEGNKSDNSDSETAKETQEKQQNSEQEASQEPKKKKQKKKKKKVNITTELATKQQTALQPSDLITALTTHFHDKLSAIEADEVLLEDKHFAICNDLTHTSMSYLKSLVPHWKRTIKNFHGQPGSPVILIICSAGLRAVHFIREISDFKTGGCKIAKLFAKHFKLQDQVKFLSKTVVHMAVGTPNRITQLLQSGGLHLDHVKYIVLDWSHRDLKQRRLTDMRETRTDLMELLRRHIIPHVKTTDGTKIALF
jgi:protein CMS1